MEPADPRGAKVPVPAHITPETFDLAHGTTAKSELLWQLSREAYGANYPDEVQPWGVTTWWTLGRFIAGLRIHRGQHLIDLACGRGGVGLWLARATGVRLTGVDWSPVAVDEARGRAAQFVPAGQARFVVGALTDTGLETASADAAVCADAVFFAADRVAMFAEVARILRSGGRFIFTADENSDPTRRTAVPDWAPLVEAGGLIVEQREEVPNWREDMQRMYDCWLANIDAIRVEVGDESADELFDEATEVAPTLATRTGVVYSVRKS